MHDSINERQSTDLEKKDTQVFLEGVVRNGKDLEEGVSQEELVPVVKMRIRKKDTDMTLVGQGKGNEGSLSSRETHQNGQRIQISYKDKILGREEKVVSDELEEQMREWLSEEKETFPSVIEEQEKLPESLPKLCMPDDRLKELCRPWKDALILTLPGKSVNLRMLKDRVAWILGSKKFDLIDLPNNYFLFKTESKEMRLKLLFGGPWLIQGHYLAVERWSPNFNPFCNNVRKVAVWVRVPTLPLYAYSEECLLEVGNLIGKALKVDIKTLAQCQNQNLLVERGKFARVSVEVDLNQPLKSRFVLRSPIYIVKHACLESICFKYGKYGHSQVKYALESITGEGSPKNPSPEVMNDQIPDEAKNSRDQVRSLISVPVVKLDEEYGSWMIASKTFRGRTKV